MTPLRRLPRIGRTARWQSRWSYAVLGACLSTGLVWFVMLDLVGWEPPRLVFWWIAHGVSGLLALMAIGAALPHHVTAAWRHHRNRLLGGATLALLGLAALVVLALLYGIESWHTPAHWLHVGLGIAAAIVFPWHVIKGRSSVAKMLR